MRSLLRRICLFSQYFAPKPLNEEPKIENDMARLCLHSLFIPSSSLLLCYGQCQSTPPSTTPSSYPCSLVLAGIRTVAPSSNLAGANVGRASMALESRISDMGAGGGHAWGL